MPTESMTRPNEVFSWRWTNSSGFRTISSSCTTWFHWKMRRNRKNHPIVAGCRRNLVPPKGLGRVFPSHDHNTLNRERQENKLINFFVLVSVSFCALNMMMPARKSSRTSPASRNDYSDALNDHYLIRSCVQEKSPLSNSVKIFHSVRTLRRSSEGNHDNVRVRVE